MPVVTVLPDRLELRLTVAERLLAFHCSDVVVDRANIRSATVTEDPWIWVRGVSAPGTAVPLTLAVGTWKFHGGRDFLLLKRTSSAVVIDLVDEDYSRLIVSTKHAPELIAALQLGTAAIPVVDADDLVILPEVAEQAERAEEAAAAKPAPAAKRSPQPRSTAKQHTARPDPSVEHASAEPSGATEAAE